MNHSQDGREGREPDGEREGFLDKARRAGALGSYLTIAVLIWLLLEARSENHALIDKLWARCPKLPEAASAPKSSEDDATVALRLLEWAATHWAGDGAPFVREPSKPACAKPSKATTDKCECGAAPAQTVGAAVMSKLGTR
jgi:hypothetical protein